MKKLLILSSLLLFLAQCATKKNTPPAWISAKPIDATGTYVYGVGMSYVNPNTSYQQAARSNALADLAQEVEGQIYDETRLLQKEDAGGFSTSLSSETLMRSHLKLEEYQLVESYSDGLRYYVLYRMDLPNFLIATRGRPKSPRLDSRATNAGYLKRSPPSHKVGHAGRCDRKGHREKFLDGPIVRCKGQK